MTEFKLVPVVPTEAMIDAGRGAGFGAVPSLVEKVYTAILAAAPPSGGNGEPFAWWKQLEMADTGEIVTCYSDDEPETTGWQPLYTAPPRVVDVVSLSVEHAKFIADILENYDDCGPTGEGWQSEKLMEINAALKAALEKP